MLMCARQIETANGNIRLCYADEEPAPGAANPFNNLFSRMLGGWR
jgi:hypothetical protein